LKLLIQPTPWLTPGPDLVQNLNLARQRATPLTTENRKLLIANRPKKQREISAKLARKKALPKNVN
jgi:hypothetical protein